MRVLTSDELGQCAGGIETVYVSGSRIYGSIHIAGYDGDNSDAQSDASNQGPGNQYNPDPAVEKEQLTDMAAFSVANDIKVQPDWRAREYGAIIYVTADGEVKSTGVIRGETVAEAQALRGLNAVPQTQLSHPSDLAGGRILAIIHSHPDEGYDTAGDIANLRPSEGSGSDWAAAENLVSSHLGEIYDFAHYILGPDGQLREYEYLTYKTQGYQQATAPISGS